MKLVMFLLAIASGYLSYILVDAFLFAMALITLLLAFTVKHWTGKND
jgi:hypothetical protein